MRLESVKLKEERQLFFAIENETRDYGCIGHLRGDFGSGKEFWTTWFPHTCHELNDEHFKTIFDAVINELRSEGQVLSGRCNMFNYAHTKHDCKLTESIYKDSAWGFRILTRDYALYLRCTPVHGDYNFVHTWGSSLNPDNVLSKLPLLGISALNVTITCLIGIVLSKFLSKDEMTRNIYIYSFTVPNMGYMGYPIVGAVLGELTLLDFMVVAVPSKEYPASG